MVLGEPEILGQVRAAWELARQAGSSGPFFNEVFQRCFRVAKRVRTETGLSAGAVSLASVTHQTLTGDLGDLAGKRAVIMGTGEIAGQMAKYLAAAGLRQLTIVSHSAGRASEFASLHGARGVPVSGLPQALATADTLVTATSCPTAVVTVAAMPTEPGRVSMIDLAHPRNIAPAVGDLPGVTLHAIDDLRCRVEAGLQQRRAQVPKAEAMVRREVRALAAWHCSRPLTQMVKDFRASFEQSRRVEMTYAASTLNEAQLAALDEASRRMVGKLLHEATLHLKPLDPRLAADRHRLDEIVTLFALRPTAAAKPAWADLEAAD